MSLLRLTAKIGADASQYHSTMGAVEKRAASTGKFLTSQLKTAFLFFVGFSGIQRMARSMYDLAERAEELKPKFAALGIEIDDALIEKAKQAKAQWEAVTMSIKVGLLPTFTKVLHKSAEILLAWGYMAKQAYEFTPGRIIGNLLQGRNSRVEAEQRWSQFKQSIKDFNAIQPFDDSQSSAAGKSVAAKAIAEAVPKLTQDSLAKIGGFTGRAGEELKSIQFKQLSELQRIQSNTESLKGGVR